MSERVLHIYFGASGNSAEHVGRGWAGQEENFRWAIGPDSILTFTGLPSDADLICFMEVVPFLRPPALTRQRLSVAIDEHELAAWDVGEFTRDLEFRIPASAIRQNGPTELVLRHPDGAAPASFSEQDGDTRVLAISFSNVSLHRPIAPLLGAIDEAHGAQEPSSGPATLVITGGGMAAHLAQIIGQLRTVTTRLHVQYVDPQSPLDAIDAALPGGLASIGVYWDGANGPQEQLRSALPSACSIVRFPSPEMQCLWPLRGRDPRVVPEPPYYPAGRYRWTDRIAATLAGSGLPDEELFQRYLTLTEGAWPDLDTMLLRDLAGWREIDANCDVKIHDHIRDNFRDRSMFDAPGIMSAHLVHHLCSRLLMHPLVHHHFDAGEAVAELDRLLIGYVGWREQVPIHPHVTRHFGLRYCDDDTRYLWGTSKLTFKEYILQYIRWTPWLR